MSQPAARLGDMHTCPAATPGVPPIPHVGGPITMGAKTVLIGNMPAARLGDMCTCVGPPSSIIKGSLTVLIENMPAARMGDSTAHGGVIVKGEPTVLIGDAGIVSPPVVIPPFAMSMPGTGKKKSGGGSDSSGSSGQNPMQSVNNKDIKRDSQSSQRDIVGDQGGTMRDFSPHEDPGRSVYEENQEQSLRESADDGDDFCEICEKMRQEQGEGGEGGNEQGRQE